MLRIVALVLVLLTTASLPAAAQQYPDRPITVLTGYPAGGMVDTRTALPSITPLMISSTSTAETMAWRTRLSTVGPA